MAFWAWLRDLFRTDGPRAQATARLAAIVTASNDAIISEDLDGVVESWNRGAEVIYGYPAEQMIGQRIDRIVPPDRMAELAAINARVEAGERPDAIETVRTTRSGELVDVTMTASPILDRRGRVIGRSTITRDISQAQQTRQELESAADKLERTNRRLRELASNDPLTGLLNRRGFERVLATEAERMRRHGHRAAVILIDCDDFKRINESFGHDGGDEVLRQIGQQIAAATRETDDVARIGGDEFMVLATETRVAEAMKLAHRIGCRVGDHDLPTDGDPVRVRVSCGVTPIDERHANLDDLLRRTSSALRVSKAAGKNTVTVTDDDQLPGPDDIHAIAQPIVDVASERVLGHELLARGPAGPFESPATLFGAHREAASLTPIDLACVGHCLRAAAHLPPDLTVHVNVFPSTLAEVGAEPLIELAQQSEFGERLCFELNEGMFVGDPATLIPHIRAIRDQAGCRIAIDDVGFGHSSLEALVVLEPEVIKIDRQFIAGIGKDRSARRQLARLVRVARSLDADIIAEGVETAADHRVLQELGIGQAQGYLWGQPAGVPVA